MQRRLVLALLIGCLAGPALAADIPAQSHIVAVTVYADRATVTREAVVDLPAGASTVLFQNLPAGLDGNSIRAQGSAEAAVTLGAVDSKVETGAKLAVPHEADLQKQMQDLQDKRDLLQAEIDANQARKTFLEDVGTAAPAAARKESADPGVSLALKPEQWTSAADTLYGGLADTLKLAVAQGIAMRDIDQQVSALQAQLNSATGAHASMTVSVPLDAAAPTSLTLKVTYEVLRATWQPLYDARLDTKTGKLDLTAYAKVRQSTGEDWTNVALTLSTAEPARGATAPTLQTMWVYLMQRMAAAIPNGSSVISAGAGGTELGYAKMQEDESRRRLEPAQRNGGSVIPVPMPAPMPAPVMPSPVAPPPPQQATFTPAQISTGGYVAEFHIVGPATIAADNSEHRVMIGAAKATASVVDLVEPAYGTAAYLVARVKLAGESPLLPGNANLFRDGSYIGAAELPLLQPGEEAPLGFGTDDQMVAKRQVLADTRGSSGTFSKDTTDERRVVTHIHNLHKTPVPVEVREAIPVPRNDKITVDILPDDTTPGYTKDADNTTGIALWTLNLAPDATSDVKLGWRVSWPEGETVTGLR